MLKAILIICIYGVSNYNGMIYSILTVYSVIFINSVIIMVGVTGLKLYFFDNTVVPGPTKHIGL